jgi:hypothetical protein
MDVSTLLNGIWLATFIIAVLFALYSWIWTESPNGDLLIWVVMAAGFGPITLLAAAFILLLLLPTLFLEKIREIVQEWKKKTVK